MLTQQFHKISKTLDHLVFAADIDGVFTYTSHYSEKLLGYSSNEMSGMHLYTIIPQNQHKKVKDYLDKVKSGQITQGLKCLSFNKDGSSFFSLWSLIWDEEDQLFYGSIKDITEQKIITDLQEFHQQRLSDKDQQVDEMLERITDGFYALDEEWRITYANSRAEQILNLKREDYINRVIWECFPGLEGGIFDEQYHKAANEKVPVQFSYYFEYFRRWYDIHVYPSDSGLSIFFQDISEQKKAEQERKEYERKIEQQNKQLVNILEQINQGFFSLDKEFKVTYWNEKAEIFYGVSKGNILGQYVRNLYSEEAQSFYRPFLQKVMSEQKALHIECICPQIGRWNEINIYPSEEGLSIFFRDIHERKETEEELHKLSLIAKETTNPVWLMDKGKKITWINDAFTKVWGYTSEEAIGRTTRELLRGPESDMGVIAQLYKAQDEGKEFRGEIISYTKCKRKLHMQLICQPLFDENGDISHFFSLQIDLTERKRLDAELKTQQRKISAAVIAAQEGERAQLGQELHDNVNQVFTTVKLYTELCRDGIGDTRDIMNKSVKLLQESINEIRSLSKLLSAPSLGNIRLKDSVKELVDTVAATNKISITLDSIGIDCLVADQEIHLGIYRIIQEHLTNILKHADATNVQILIEAMNGKLSLEIIDDGKGFDTNKRRRGIGITNMMTRTDALNGQIDIQSEPEHGCKLLVNLPLFVLKDHHP